jgi:hypothetical protein
MSDEAIFVPVGKEGYELCHPIDAVDFETIHNSINGTRVGEIWRPIPMKLIRLDEGKALMKSDAPWLADSSLIFRQESIGAFGKILDRCGELLPLECKDANLLVFNPVPALDALDIEKSSIQRFESGNIMWISKYSFKRALVLGVDAFKLEGLSGSPTFLSNRFVDAWNSSGLEGLEFRQVG